MDLENKLKKLGNFYYMGTNKVYTHKKTKKKYHWIAKESYSQYLQRIFNDINQPPTG